MDNKTIHTAVSGWRRRTGCAGRRLRAALIDMDGTLYDSMPNHARAWHRLAGEAGIQTTVDEFFGYEGMTGRDTINRLFNRAFGHDATEEQIAELYHRKTLYFSEQPPVGVMPGARQVVTALAAAGITPVLVTGSGQGSLIGRLDTDYPGLFARDRRVTARDVTHGKPAPEPYLRAMALARVDASESLVIENAPLGVRAGVASRAFTVAVTTGPIPRGEMAEAGADIIFSSMPELARYVEVLIEAFNTPAEAL